MCTTFECPNCGRRNFLFDDARVGDRAKCAACRKEHKIEAIQGPYRSDKKPMTLHGQLPVNLQ
jgi:hypothetical protein